MIYIHLIILNIIYIFTTCYITSSPSTFLVETLKSSGSFPASYTSYEFKQPIGDLPSLANFKISASILSTPSAIIF